MITTLIVFGWITSYFLIGHLYACWYMYRLGAGFEPQDIIREVLRDVAFLFYIGWPIVMIIHVVFNIHDMIDDNSFLSKFSRESFRKKGEVANDIDLQAEKHLLGGKK